MGIEKMVESVRVSNDKENFTVLHQDTLQAITNPDALAIWAYLQSLPSSWIIRKNMICERFGLGRDRYYKALTYLREAGLLSYRSCRSDEGQIETREVMVHFKPIELNCGKPNNVDKPQRGKTAPYKETMATKEDLQSTKETVSVKPKKKKASGVKVTLRAYLEANPNPEWVPVDGKVHKHMKGSGIPMEWLVLAIHAFSDKFIDDQEPRYVNWAASFANYVVEGWLDLWYHDAKSNGWALTRTKGMAYQIKVNGGTGNV